MSLTITSPASNATVSGNSVTLSGTSTQSVNGTALASQSFSTSVDISGQANGSTFTLTITNSAGNSASITLKKQAVESADGTILTDTSSTPGTGVVSGSIIDASGAAWTLHNDPTYGNVVYKAGAQIGNTDHVVSLLYFGKNFYVKGNDGNWYAFSTATTSWSETANGADPRVTSETTSNTLWGINIHFWGSSAPYQNSSNMITKAQDLSMKTLRCGYAVGDYPLFTSFINSYAQPAGIAVYPVLLPNVNQTDSNGNIVFTTETLAYNYGYSMGQEVATNLGSLVSMIEIGNEPEDDCLNGGDGNAPTDYDNTSFIRCRGVYRGIVDGIKSVNSTITIGSPATTWLHYGFNDMLWNGTQPDGTTGHPTVRWDITCWHWYSDMGNPLSATGGSGTWNVPQTLQTKFGKPLAVTEFGVRPSYSTNETTIGNYMIGSNMMAAFYNNKSTYNIVHCAIYEMFDDGSSGDEGKYGMTQYNGTTNKGRYSIIKNYVSTRQS